MSDWEQLELEEAAPLKKANQEFVEIEKPKKTEPI